MMKYIFVIFLGFVCVSVQAQTEESGEAEPWDNPYDYTIRELPDRYSTGDLYNGMTRTLMNDRMIIPYGLEVTFDKTVHIIFPASIRYVDLGSTDIIAGKADGVENVLRVKASRRNFEKETNFTVITDDGLFYAFNVLYAAEPLKLSIEMSDLASQYSPVSDPGNRLPVYLNELGGDSPRMIDLIMNGIHDSNKRYVKHIGVKRFGIDFTLRGIYTYGGIIYFHLQIVNNSYIPLDIDFIHFNIVSKKVIKRMAMQQQSVEPLRMLNYRSAILGKSKERMILAMPKFMLPHDKKLVVELFETDNGRHLTFDIENSDLLRAQSINDLKIY